MKDIMEEVAKERSEVVDDQWLNMKSRGGAWDRSQDLYRTLKALTDGEAKRIVTNLADANGWEAWRQLCMQDERAWHGWCR